MLTDQMRHRFPGLACRALLFLLLSCLTVQAQSASTAQLNGSVKDQSGAHQVEFGAEVFNVFNRVQLNVPVSALKSPNFGLITSAADPRIIQLALKYTF